MGQQDKLISQILSGNSDKNIPFEQLVKLLIFFGFNERIKGSHHIFTIEGVEEIINIQPVGKLSKAYQVKQVRNIITKYRLIKGNYE